MKNVISYSVCFTAVKIDRFIVVVQHIEIFVISVAEYGSEGLFVQPVEPITVIIDGAGYTVIFTFTGLKQGKTKMTIQERSPITDNTDTVYNVTVADDLCVTLTKMTTNDIDDAVIEPNPTLVIDTGKQV